MRLASILFVSLSLSSAGCVDLGESSARVGEGGDEGGAFDRDACKIEGSQIGREGVTVSLGSKLVTIHDWVGKTGESGEYVGFSMTVDGAASVGYVVKASGELHHSTALTWLHPAGADGGDKAPGISNVDFCEECTDGSCGGGDDGGDGEGCSDPDGCPDGGGDGGDGGTCDNPDGCPDGGGGGDTGGGDTGCTNPDGCGDGGDGTPIL